MAEETKKFIIITNCDSDSPSVLVDEANKAKVFPSWYRANKEAKAIGAAKIVGL